MGSDYEDRISDAIEETVAEFLQKAEELKGTHSVPAEELFPPSFMQEHTTFENVEAFLVNGNFDPDRDGDWDALADDGLDRHVQETTAFDSWAAMKDVAKEEWMLSKLKSSG